MADTSQWTDAIWDALNARPLPGFPDYAVTRFGAVLSLKSEMPRLLKPIRAKDGHLYVFCYRQAKQYKVWVHRAVLYAFVGQPEPRQECRHLDGNPANNHLSNLAWGTRLQNMADKARHGTQPVGEKSGTHKLTASDVVEMRRLYPKLTLRALAREYGVSHTAVRRAIKGIKWASVKEGLPV